MNKTKNISLKCTRYYAPVWAPPGDFAVAGGKGTYLYGADGKKYIDFVTGIAVNALGYAHPKLQKAYREFGKQPLHASALFLQEDRVLLAEMLVKNSFADNVFFCNSGTEAIEGCIKFARKWAYDHYSAKKHKVISFRNGFHGRSYGALSATAQEKFHKGFKPIVPGFIYLPANDLKALKKAADKNTVCAVLVEPVQAEGGILEIQRKWIREVRKICDARNILLIFDEIQTGMGRLGKLWGHQLLGVKPEIMACAKALGGGIPFGAVLMKKQIASCLKPGDHGNTTGGSPLAAKLGTVVLKELLKPSFLKKTRENAVFLQKSLKGLQKKFPGLISGTRGRGMLQGLVLKADVLKAVAACRAKGLLVCKAGPDVLRLIPPLNVKQAEIKKAVSIIESVLKEI